MASIGGAGWAVAGEGSRAVLAAGLRLASFDISDPVAPRLVDTAGPLEDTPRGLAVAGDLLAVAGGTSGLGLYDLSRSGELVELSTLPTTAAAVGVALRGSLAYVLVQGQGLVIVDMTEPTRPREVGAHAAPDCVDDVLLWERRALLACGRSGAQLLDVHDPARPTLLGTYRPEVAIHRLERVERNVVASDGEDFVVLDASLPGPPVEIIRLFSGLAGDEDLASNGTTIYASGEKVAVFDLSDPTRARTMAPVGSESRGFVALAVTGDRLLAADGYAAALHIFDASSPNRPVVLGRAVDDDLGEVFRLAADQGPLVVWATELALYDGRVLPPVRLWNREVLGRGGLVVRDPMVYLGSDGMRVLDATEPTAPVLTRPADDTWIWSALALGADRLLALGGPPRIDGGEFRAQLVVWDASEPAWPRPMGRTETYLPPLTLAVSPDGAWAYVGETAAGPGVADVMFPAQSKHALEAYDVANADSPRSVWRLDSAEAIAPRAVVGQHLLATGKSGLLVYDRSDPARPRLQSALSTGCAAQAFALHGRYAFLGCLQGVQVLDLSDPTAPRLTYELATPRPASALAVTGGMLWIGQGNAGLQGLRLEE